MYHVNRLALQNITAAGIIPVYVDIGGGDGGQKKPLVFKIRSNNFEMGQRVFVQHKII